MRPARLFDLDPHMQDSGDIVRLASELHRPVPDYECSIMCAIAEAASAQVEGN